MYVTDLINWTTNCILHVSVIYAKVNVCFDSHSVVSWVHGGAVSVIVCVNMVDMGKEEPPTLTGWCEWWWPDTKASSRKQIKNRMYATWKLLLKETSVQLIRRETAATFLFYSVCFIKFKYCFFVLWDRHLAGFICSSLTESLTPFFFFSFFFLSNCESNVTFYSTHVDRNHQSCILNVMLRQDCLCQTGPEVSAAPSQTSLPSLITALCVADLST